MATQAVPQSPRAPVCSACLLRLNPINQRRLANFHANRRGCISLYIFLVLFVVSLLAEVIANDRPLLICYDGAVSISRCSRPIPRPPSAASSRPRRTTRDPAVRRADRREGLDRLAADPLQLRHRRLRSGRARARAADRAHWLGTDDQARDVAGAGDLRLSHLGPVRPGPDHPVARSSASRPAPCRATSAACVDLSFQRFIEIWNSMPTLFMLIILASVVAPNFWWLLGLLLLFSWMTLVGLVRAEFLRARNFDFVRAARALGVSHLTIMRRHVLPNAMVATVTFMPFVLIGGITSLTSPRLPGLRPAARLAVPGRAPEPGQEQPPGPLARHHRLRRHGPDALAAGLHRRGGARCLRSAQDLPLSAAKHPSARPTAPSARLRASRDLSALAAPQSCRVSLSVGRAHVERSQRSIDGRDAGAGRRERLGQVGDRALDPAAAALSQGLAPGGSIRLDGQELIGAPSDDPPPGPRRSRRRSSSRSR